MPATAHDEWRDTRVSPIAPLLYGLAGIRRFRRRAMSLALRLEGGEFHSKTARRIMRQYFGISIGAYSYGACFTQGLFQGPVEIGRYTSIGPDTTVYRRNHPISCLSTHPFFYNSKLGYVPKDTLPFRPLVIGDDAWIGARVFVTPSCGRIGIGSIVAAGAVVTKDVPDFAIVAGVPATTIKMRFPLDIQEAILGSRWWEKSIQDCTPHMNSMKEPVATLYPNHPLFNETHQIAQ